MDGKYARGLTALWLWNELGELCRLLAWPVWGGAANYCFFFLLAGNRNGLPTLGSVFAAAAAASVLLCLGCAASKAGAAMTVRKLSRTAGSRQ